MARRRPAPPRQARQRGREAEHHSASVEASAPVANPSGVASSAWRPASRLTSFTLAGRAIDVDNGPCFAAMRVRVSDPALLGDLQRYLRSAECVVEQSDDDAHDVSMPRAPSDDQARREVAIYPKTWQAMNPGARAEIVA
jgi:hypothetical protein